MEEVDPLGLGRARRRLRERLWRLSPSLIPNFLNYAGALPPENAQNPSLSTIFVHGLADASYMTPVFTPIITSVLKTSEIAAAVAKQSDSNGLNKRGI